jgi:hypothetical protein
MSELAHQTFEQRRMRTNPRDVALDTVRSSDCTAIAFERRGDGPSLVLVDGALCDRRLVAADRRGDAVRLFLRQMGAPAIAIGLMRLLPVWTKLTRIAHTLPYDMTIVVPYQAGTPLPAERRHDVKISTLVMVGGKSPAWFHHSTQELADVLPNAAHCVVEGQTHNVKAESLAPPLGDFFDT